MWRPTFSPLEDHPLAVCDARTVDKSDLVPADLIYPHHMGEKFDVLWNERHKWYYLSNMNAEEGILLKNFDSVMDGRARRMFLKALFVTEMHLLTLISVCPHVSFRHVDTPKSALPRQSIEVRAMVFHE